MRAQTRIGLGAGGVGFVLLYLAQRGAALGALWLLVLVSALAGLSMAKWLPRDWYGRQFAAGLRAGALASAGGVIGVLLSLIFSDSHTIPTLAERSRLLWLDLGPAVRALGSVGWLGAAFLLALAAGALAAALAGLLTLAGAWDKNQHAIQVVERAREAAQRASRLPGGGRAAFPASAPEGRMLGGSGSWPPLQSPPTPSGTAWQEAEAPSAVPATPPYAGAAAQDVFNPWASTSERTSERPPGVQPAKPAVPEQPEAAPQRSDKDSWLC